MIIRLVIDPAKVGNAQIFIPEGWEAALIVSGRVAQALEPRELDGIRLIPVMTDPVGS